MKRIVFILALIVSFTSCQKEDPIEPVPTAIAPTTTTGGTTTGGTTDKFYVGILANYQDDNNGAHETFEVVPDVSIGGVPLTYLSYTTSTNYITSGVLDVVFEYDIPISLGLNCNDLIDFEVSLNTDSLNIGDVLQEIQIAFNKKSNMVPSWGGSNSLYNIASTTPNPLVMNYYTTQILCN